MALTVRQRALSYNRHVRRDRDGRNLGGAPFPTHIVPCDSPASTRPAVSPSQRRKGVKLTGLVLHCPRGREGAHPRTSVLCLHGDMRFPSAFLNMNSKKPYCLISGIL